MPGVTAITTAGGEASLKESEVEAFSSHLRGELLRPSDGGYDAARRVWNATVDHHPALIARCAGTQDVVESVRFGAEHGLLTSVRCGGHNVAGKAVADRGLMIDLSLFRGVEVDPGSRTARTAGGALLGDLDRATQAHGLATTAGVVDHTGVAGLTLGGGVGRLARKHGLACDNLIGAEVVTAAGNVVRASATENPDLFWGLRGGGGNFGIVTSLEFRVHPVGPQVLGGAVVHPIADARAAMEFYRDFAPEAPGELSLDAALLTSPDGQPCFAFSVVAIGPMDEAEQALEPLRRFGKPLVDQIAPVAYLDVQAAGDQAFPIGGRYFWKSHFLGAIPDGLIEADIEHFAKAPSPRCMIAWQQFGGAIGRVDRSDSAFWHRDVHWDHFPVSIWSDPADTESHVSWAREWWEPTLEFSLGGEYVNNLGEEGEDRVRASYGGNYDRLAVLKKKYDPTNFFRLNANIQPAE